MKFRADIQIFRGIAVLYVVLFHLGFQFAQSGFLGVDVFFVISGFLMASLYQQGKAKEFFTRRAKRLFPAYFFVILVTLIVSFIMTTPNESHQVAAQALWGSGFLSNIGFWSQNSYFSKAEFNPLLHLWSLGVEVQFYLIVPILAWFFSKSRFFFYSLFAVSLTLCLFVLTISPKTSFFMMPLRIWEFLIGYGIALYLTQRGNVQHTHMSWLGALGLIFVMLIPLLGINGQSLHIIDGHPGLAAFLVTIATGLVLAFGLPKVLESNPLSNVMVFLGKYSYSIYLAHFPIIVLFLFQPFGGTILSPSSLADVLILIAMIAVFSALLYRFVESRKLNVNVWKLSLISALTLWVLALSLPWLKSITLSDPERKVFAAFQDRSTYRCGKLVRVLDPTALSCRLSGNKKTTGAIFLVGNSHADAMKTTFSEVASVANKSVYFAVSNIPMMLGGPSASAIIDESLSHGVEHIVVHYSPSGYSPFTLQNLEKLVKLAGNEGISVAVIEPVPVWEEHIPQLMYRQLQGSEQKLSQSKEDYLHRHAMVFEGLDKLKAAHFRRVPVYEYFCQPDCEYKNKENVPLYFDSGHLTLTGSKKLKQAIADAIAP